MIYTCYEMIRDCRAGSAAGWTYLLRHYAPVIGVLLAHYFPERRQDTAFLERMLLELRKPDSSLFRTLDPVPERAFVAELRQHVLGLAESEAGVAPRVSIDLQALSAALEPLTVTEKLTVWLEAMRYSNEETGRMLRMSAETAEKIRDRAAELVRSAVDRWSRSLLPDNGPALRRASAGVKTSECLQAKAFFDVIDGRTTWYGREEMERHVKSCWYCLDHYCRLLEVVDVLRASKPLADSELERYRHLLGIELEKRPFWKRLAGAG